MNRFLYFVILLFFISFSCRKMPWNLAKKPEIQNHTVEIKENNTISFNLESNKNIEAERAQAVINLNSKTFNDSIIINLSKINDNTFKQTIDSLAFGMYYYYFKAYNEVGTTVTPIDSFYVNSGVNNLKCNEYILSGDIVKGAELENVYIDVPYVGGNGGSYDQQVFISTGIDGLQVTLPAGQLNRGNGVLKYIISGEPSNTGIAVFEIFFLGNECVISIPVETGRIDSLDCSGIIHEGQLFTSSYMPNVKTVIPYLGGNGGSYYYDEFHSTNFINLKAELYEGTLSNNNGSFELYFTGIPQSAGEAYFTVNILGKECTFTRDIVLPNGNISSLECNNAYNFGNLYSQNQSVNVSSSIPYTQGNGGTYDYLEVESIGVTGLTARLNEGVFVTGDGELVFEITGTPNNEGIAIFPINIGGISCNLERQVTLPEGNIQNLICNSYNNDLNYTVGQQIINEIIEIGYQGGNGGYYEEILISSNNITGLTLYNEGGVLSNGSGNIVLRLNGTPTLSGYANFNISIGGKNCTLSINIESTYRNNTVHCISPQTTIVEVLNPVTGRTWMDRNLGATRSAISSTDNEAYGDLYQWGRFADGHQCRTSSNTSTISTTDTPGNSSFIVTNVSGENWRNPKNNNLWQGENGINNPCPLGFRLPTELEMYEEMQSWTSNDANGAYNSPLKLTLGGRRSDTDGTISSEGISGRYLTSSVSGTNHVRGLLITNTNATLFSSGRAFGGCIRCIKD